MSPYLLQQPLRKSTEIKARNVTLAAIMAYNSRVQSLACHLLHSCAQKPLGLVNLEQTTNAAGQRTTYFMNPQ